jgi:hypothetical protein
MSASTAGVRAGVVCAVGYEDASETSGLLSESSTRLKLGTTGAVGFIPDFVDGFLDIVE